MNVYQLIGYLWNNDDGYTAQTLGYFTTWEKAEAMWNNMNKDPDFDKYYSKNEYEIYEIEVL